MTTTTTPAANTASPTTSTSNPTPAAPTASSGGKLERIAEGLNNVVTSTLVFEGDGRIGEYVGGYTDWLRQRHNKPAPKSESPAKAPKPATAPGAQTPRTQSRKLSYKEQREIETLPGKIETLEVEQSQLQAAVSAAGFYQQPGEAISATLARLQSITAELEEYYARWEALESLATAAK